jgi:hypothetical protein
MKASSLSKLIETLQEYDVEISYDLAWDIVELFKNNGLDVEQLEDCTGIDTAFDQVLKEIINDDEDENDGWIDQDDF